MSVPSTTRQARYEQHRHVLQYKASNYSNASISASPRPQCQLKLDNTLIHDGLAYLFLQALYHRPGPLRRQNELHRTTLLRQVCLPRRPRLQLYRHRQASMTR
jgi:hypothetical protein